MLLWSDFIIARDLWTQTPYGFIEQLVLGVQVRKLQQTVELDNKDELECAPIHSMLTTGTWATNP
jgi:hypothetical protein